MTGYALCKIASDFKTDFMTFSFRLLFPMEPFFLYMLYLWQNILFFSVITEKCTKDLFSNHSHEWNGIISKQQQDNWFTKLRLYLKRNQ